MSYRIRLCLTHLAAAAICSYCLWYGLQVQGFSQIAFVILLAAGIAGPCTLAAWWLNRGLDQLEAAMANASDDSADTDLAELNQLASRLRGTLKRQRLVVQQVDELLGCLGHPGQHSESSMAGRSSSLLMDVLGKLSRGSAKDLGAIMNYCEEISRGLHDTQSGAQDQTRTVANAISSIADLSGRIDDIGTDAQVAASAAKDVAARATKGLDVIRQLMLGMEDIRTNVAINEKKVTSLGQQSEQISSIAETMGDLSARTNMLALNASLEAVRAGQEGRGFALVAEEVRKLADSTATAARDIAALVTAIQNEASDTISAMTDERQQVLEELQRVREAGRTLEDISRTATAAADRSRHISESTTDQLQRTQEVVRAMQQVSGIAGRISEKSDGIRGRTTDLLEAAQGLEESLSPMYHFADSHKPVAERKPAGLVSAPAGRRSTSRAASSGPPLAASRNGELLP